MLRRLKIAHVPGVQNIKTPVGERDTATRSAQLNTEFSGSFSRNDLGTHVFRKRNRCHSERSEESRSELGRLVEEGSRARFLAALGMTPLYTYAFRTASIISLPVTEAVPRFITTRPPAQFAIMAACRKLAPAPNPSV